MSAQPGVLIQANFKTAAGTLLNVYGQDEASFDIGLAILHDRLAQMTEIEQQLRGASAVAAVLPLAPTQPAAQPAPTAAGSGWAAPAASPPPPPALPQSFQQAAQVSCVHGPMIYRAGVISQKTGAPYTAFYSCAQGKASTCKTVNAA